MQRNVRCVRVILRKTNWYNLMMHILGGEQLKNNKMIKSSRHIVLDVGKDPKYCNEIWKIFLEINKNKKNNLWIWKNVYNMTIEDGWNEMPFNKRPWE